MNHIISASLVVVSLMLSAGMNAGYAESCEDKTTQTDMNVCAGKAFQQADKELNALYLQIKARLKDHPGTTKRLEAAQHAWLAFRVAECSFSASGGRGGSVYPMIVSSCQENLTRERIKAFHDYLNCQEGDLSCPLPPDPNGGR